MKRGCNNCKYRTYPVLRSPCDNCAMSGDKYSEWTAQTNADRIRAMTDEELAKMLSEYTDCICGVYKKGCGKTQDTCVATWLDWLRKEVKE